VTSRKAAAADTTLVAHRAWRDAAFCTTIVIPESASKRPWPNHAAISQIDPLRLDPQAREPNPYFTRMGS
jgi:hypothetical protein